MATGVILADDLTGAADACATFVTRGCSGAVVFDAAASAAGPDVDVVSISTDTRGVPVTLAIDRVRAAVRHVTAAHPSALLFKKIDSTLRGHVGREITATMDVSRARVAIVAPAFPAMGRTVDDGVLRVTGTGALKPRHVVTLLEEQGVRGCRHLARPQAPGDWRALMDAAIHDGARVLVCDAVVDADLDAIVDAASALDRLDGESGRDDESGRGPDAWPDERGAIDGPVLWVGSAGLADAIARQRPELARPSVHGESAAHPAERAGEAARVEPFAGCDALASGAPVVFWIGSHHPVTVEQRRMLLTQPGVAAAGGVVNCVERVAQLLDRRAHVLLDVGPAVSNDTIAQLVERVVEREVGGLVMSGGDTAARVCRAFDAAAIQLAGEVSRGTPHGWLLTRSRRRWPIVLKSGGFGTPRALVDVLAFLSDRKTQHV